MKQSFFGLVLVFSLAVFASIIPSGTHIIAHDQTAAYAGTILTSQPRFASGYRCTVYVKCNTAVPKATIIPQIMFIADDNASTPETLTGATATCTMLGNSDVSSSSWNVHVAPNTKISVQTTIANSPHYNLDAFCELTSTK